MSYDREHFYHMLLSAIDAPVTQANVDALTAWGECEGSEAEFNPLDTTMHEEGATPYNTFGNDQHVWNYPDEATGVKATAATLEQDYYPHILEALRSGTGEIVTGDAASEMRVWGTDPDCIREKISGQPTQPTVHPDARPLNQMAREFVTRAHRALDNHMHPAVHQDRVNVQRLIDAAERFLKRGHS